MKTKRKINLSCRVYTRHETIQRYYTSSIRRFRNKIASINWQNQDINVYLRVSYGGDLYNDGIYQLKNDFYFALEAFTDKRTYCDLEFPDAYK